ncbi:MAG: PPOX class F420-dependent oxidoreductase [Candidatus Bathyarchaeia archaeon]|jgi:PPOX class probable F420-dependent enzyme
MGVKLPQNAVKLIEAKNFAHLATLLRDGSPHVAPVWVDHDGDIILINTAVGRVKHKNIMKDPRVGISITDQNNPYERVEIRGRVISETREGADEHIDKLANKYTGAKKYQKSSPDEKRIILKIEPLQISS